MELRNARTRRSEHALLRGVGCRCLDRNGHAVAPDEVVRPSVISIDRETRVREICVQVQLEDPRIERRGLKLLDEVSVGILERREGIRQRCSG
jgi:hypothetical protein